MEKTLALKTKTQGAIAFCSLMLLGCAFLIAASFLRIPFYPVSFTMHTFALAFLALTQSPRLAASSACCFLVAATVGLPVFCGLANPLWIVGKAGGYLVAFPIAAYIISSCARTLPKMVALMIGQCIIYLLGLLWLIPLVGLKTAFFAGVMIFIPSDILKNLMALSAVSLWEKLRAQMNPVKEVWIGWVSSLVEAYNMAIYCFIVPLLGPLIFPHKSSGEALFFSYSLCLVGSSIFYPLGALYYGWMGDK